MTDYLKSLWSFGSLVLVIWQIFLRLTLCSSPLTCIEFDYSPYTWSCCFIRHLMCQISLVYSGYLCYLLFGLFCTLRCKNHRNVPGQNRDAMLPTVPGVMNVLMWTRPVCVLARVCLYMSICMWVLDDYWMKHEKAWFLYSFLAIAKLGSKSQKSQ